MKVGRCPSCKYRMVLVQHYRCGCGKGHTKIRQAMITLTTTCPTPRTIVTVRAHGCGRLLHPLDSTELEGIPA